MSLNCSSIVRPSQPAGAIPARTYPDPPRGRYFQVRESLLLSDDLNSTETLLVLGIGMHDWGDGRGGWPSNATLAKFCKIKASTTEGAERCVRRLIAGVSAKGYIEVREVAQTKANRTGRELFLLPRATGQPGRDPGSSTPDTTVTCTERPRTLRSGK